VALEDFAILAEFSLGVLAISGFQPISLIANITASGCTEAIQRMPSGTTDLPKFPKKLARRAPSAWLRHFFEVRQKVKDKIHITADRYVRYLRTQDTRDGLLDLCICLESLIESQTEISFRFGVCLAKISGLDNSESVCDLLSNLYDLRSRIVHGSDSTKEHKKIQPNIKELRAAARAILTRYLLYMTDHSIAEWKKYLRSSLFV
jgi:hypothetical protein